MSFPGFLPWNTPMRISSGIYPYAGPSGIYPYAGSSRIYPTRVLAGYTPMRASWQLARCARFRLAAYNDDVHSLIIARYAVTTTVLPSPDRLHFCYQSGRFLSENGHAHSAKVFQRAACRSAAHNSGGFSTLSRFSVGTRCELAAALQSERPTRRHLRSLGRPLPHWGIRGRLRRRSAFSTLG